MIGREGEEGRDREREKKREKGVGVSSAKSSDLALEKRQILNHKDHQVGANLRFP